MANIGFGDNNFSFAVYIANKPNMMEYQSLSTVQPLCRGEINVINQACGNGWRKVFNVYAKVLYALNKKMFDYSVKAPTWQEYRDNYLLQGKSKTALLFSSPQLLTSSLSTSQLSTSQLSALKNCTPYNDIVHIICGKGHAHSLIESGALKVKLVWLDDEFAIDMKSKLIVCPYFDYRQLSNIKIERLSELLLSVKLNN